MKIWEGRLRTLWGEWVVFSFGVEAVGFRRQQLRYNTFGGPFRQKMVLQDPVWFHVNWWEAMG